LSVPPPEGSPQASFPGELPVGPLRAANPFESDWGFRRCGLVFAAPGPPTAVHLPSPPPLPPSPHALPMRFPGKVPGEGLEKPRPDRAVGTPGADPGEGRGFVRASPMDPPRPPSGERSPGKTRHGLRETPRESPGGRGERPRGKAPGSTWGDGGSGGAGGCPTPRAGSFARETPQTG
jgi:hypothetical protein